MAAILPLAETVLLGGVDGALRAADAKAGRTTTFKAWSTYLELGVLGLGAIAATQRVHPDIWEPAVIGSLFALSQRAGAFAGHAISPASFGGGYGGGWGNRAVGAPFPMEALPGPGVTGPRHERYAPHGVVA